MLPLKFIAFILIGALCLTANAQRRQDQEIPEELYKIAQQQAQKIRAATSDKDQENEWFGTYYDGEHHPTMFMWSPNDGFLVTSSLHTFSPSWLNYGKVSFEKGLLTIFPELPKGHTFAHIMPTEFRAIHWDKQHFLIPPSELMGFAYAVHSRSEFQVGQYFLKASDRDLSRNGMPELPAEYTKYLHMKPIRGRLVSVRNVEERWSPVFTLNAGRRQGIVEGMLLYHVSKSGVHYSIRIDRVSDTTATADVSSSASSNDSNDEGPKVGWVFSSRMPVGFIEPD
jgi:hypothetical protein